MQTNHTSTLSSAPVDAATLDADLVRSIAEFRSEKALQELYRRHQPLLRSVIRRVLNSDTETDDVLQDVFLQVWNNASAYSPEKGQFLGWLITVARRRAVDRLRQICAYKNATDRFEASLEPETPNFQQSTTEQEVQHNELRDRISTHLGKLPEAQQQVVKLTYFQGLSHREIAARLSVPLGTIKTRIELGIRKLSRSLLTEQAA